MSVSIKYDGSVIETIEGGQTITLHTSGMRAKTDIVIQNNPASNNGDGGETEQTCTISGIYKFNPIISFPSFVTGEYLQEKFYFTNDELGKRCNAIAFRNDSSYKGMAFSGENGSVWSPYWVYNHKNDTWYNNGGKQITIEGSQEVSEEFYEWFTANTTKLSGGDGS